MLSISLQHFQAQFQPKDIEEMESRHNDITKLAESLKASFQLNCELIPANNN